MINRDVLKRIREQQYNLKLAFLPDNPKYEVGNTYFCEYWRQTYKVLGYTENTNDWRGWCVTVQWQDGEINSHSTSLNKDQDFLVVS
jgi:hypothetical protein